MIHRSPWLASIAGVVMCTAGVFVSRPAPAADWQESLLYPAARSWMRILTLVAEDGGQAEQAPERGDREGRGRHGKDPGRQPPSSGPSPRVDAIAKLDEVLGRLGRIESMLAARPMPGTEAAPGRPQPGPGRPQAGPGRSESPRSGGRMPAVAQERMEAWAREVRERGEQMTAEERMEIRRKMEEARARMRAGGRRGRPDSTGTAGEQRPPDHQTAERPNPPGTDVMRAAMMERFAEARKRFAMMEERIKSLEGEVQRLQQMLKDND